VYLSNALTMHYPALMDDGTRVLAQAIGARVKHERQTRRWTLDQLAEAAAVSRRMVVNIEQGGVNPSVGTLLRLASALGVGLPSLVDLPRAGAMTITRSGEAARLWTSPSGGHGDLVAATDAPDVTELWEWTLYPGDVHTSEPHLPGTKELIQVHEGSVAIEAGERSVTLEPGDAVAFPGDIAHSYANSGSETARFSLAVSEPKARSTTRSDTHA